MTPEANRHLNELLHIFGTASLGEGDPVAGANLLAAMAASIANISPPGSGLQAPDGETLETGASLLVSGGHSTSIVDEKILSGLGGRQNNLNSHLRSHVRNHPDKPKAAGNFEAEARTTFMDRYGSPTLEGLYAPGDLHCLGVAGPWGAVIRQPATTDFEELRDRHVVFAAKGATGNLTDLIDHAHHGRPCLHVELDNAPHFSRVARQCLDVMDGRGSSGLSSQIVRGTVIITDPSGILGEVMRAEGVAGLLASRVVWLVDGNAGPEPVEPSTPTDLVTLDSPGFRYKAAMEQAWGSRLDHRKPGPVLIDCNFHSLQAKWIAFLKTQEAAVPGITGTARNLLATLAFGLVQMMNASRLPNNFKWCLPQIEALARFLVHRMANARAAMLYSAQSARKLMLEEQILRKLGNDRLTVRDITRRFSRLPAEQCRELLLDLEAAGKVCEIDGFWQVRQSPTRATSSPRQLTLEA
jgi:hypothetical protein